MCAALCTPLFVAVVPAGAQEVPDRVIQGLNARDPVFADYSLRVEEGYKAASRRQADFVPAVYEYTAVAGDTVFSIASRCSIPYETLVSANGIRSSDEMLAGKKLFLPAGPGVFVPDDARNPVEELLKKTHTAAGNSVMVNGRGFDYLPGARFTGETRMFFLDPSFILPLAEGVLTSGFGNRQSPVSGQWEFHRGVDMGAPEGTPVMAAKSGKVNFVGANEIYGNYIVVAHANDMESLYGHLSKMLAEQGAVVARGDVIGQVGTTGMSTGPHLHFEIHAGKTARDPRGLIKNAPALNGN
ncbi:MAG: M23 family metallopeptidase [Spirochaetaceae bacterium]|jgi:murein DD-endopeptidase MepM/ murein hydrolase activator NlpD|nr:M23 family metallopeptidase [Spirochaetaceae bacterium]